MKLYEVIFWGSQGDGNAEDTIYLVRAPNFTFAVDEVRRNGRPEDHGHRSRDAHKVYEIGDDSSPYAEAHPGILRGPYFEFAYNRGWKSWERKFEGADYTMEWEEDQK